MIKKICYILLMTVHQQVSGGVPGEGTHLEIKKLKQFQTLCWWINNKNQIVYVHFAFYRELLMCKFH